MSEESLSPTVRERTRALALKELSEAGPVQTGWRAEALRYVLTLFVFIAAATCASGLLGLYDTARFWAQAPYCALLALSSGLGTWAAATPRPRSLIALSVLLALTAAAILVLRRIGAPEALPTNPGWVCSTSHFAVALLPLSLGIFALRQSSWRLARALVAGVAIGTPGAMMGELACQRGWRHALVHHVGAWVAVTLVLIVISRRMTPRSYAP